MADPFRDANMRGSDYEHLERDLRLEIRAATRNQKPIDFNRYHRDFFALAKKRGMETKAAKAWATLKIVEFKKSLDDAIRLQSN